MAYTDLDRDIQRYLSVGGANTQFFFWCAERNRRKAHIVLRWAASLPKNVMSVFLKRQKALGADLKALAFPKKK